MLRGGRGRSGCIGARARASLPLFECGGCSALALAAGRINAFKSIVKSETKELRQLAEERELAQESSALVLRQLAEVREQKAHKQLKQLESANARLEEGFAELRQFAEVREQKAHKQLKQLESANARLEEGFVELRTETRLQFKKIEEGLTVLLAQAAAEAARREETNSQAQ